MRGARPCSSSLICITGIIPAYAGSTHSARGSRDYRQDHPRVCGEHLSLKTRLAQGAGSSPRMRGAHSGDERNATLDWIIPAYAGSTKPIMCGEGMCWDHPRVCGEHPII